MSQGSSDWDIQKSEELYGTSNWGKGYFKIDPNGQVKVTPDGNGGPALNLHDLTKDLCERGLRLPILVRFPGIVKSRIELINGCFSNSITEYGYKGKYQGVFPIKVNQQKHLVEEIIQYGRPHNLGLECGSKPELLIALAFMDTPEAMIICNGFKDAAYVETALLSRKLGRNTYVVIERAAEIDLVIEASKKLGISPKIGFRCKLKNRPTGRWYEASGARSKFGLTPPEMVNGFKKLKEAGMLECLDMLHFHAGSQISSIQSLKATIREGSRYFTEFYAMGAKPTYIDVGGGLGVDYDGSGKGDSSTNYSEQEYANDVVSIIQSTCDEKSVPHPNIITESGRALVAHTSILIFNVVGENRIGSFKLESTVSEKDSRLVQDLNEIYQNVKADNINEFYNDLIEKKRDTQQLFSYGVLGLEQKAKAEELCWATASKLAEISKNIPEAEDTYWALQNELTDIYYCNFSVFQSLPDLWAVGQRFPVMPIHRLDEEPKRRVTFVDLTCDSDGKIDSFNDPDSDETQSYLEAHDLIPNEDYCVGVFLTGAYQEILGDLHNLFGDTDAVHISLTESGYCVEHVIEGDSVSEVLSYVEYGKPQLIERIRQASEAGIGKGTITRGEARLLMRHYEQGLSSYTYLEDPVVK